MPVPTIATLPAAPLPGDTQAEHDAKAYPFVSALGPMGTQINDLALWMEDQIIKVSHVAAEITSTNFDVDASNNFNYLWFTSTSAKTVTVRPDADHTLPVNYELNIRNAAASNLTFVQGSGVTITPPAGGTLVVPPNGTVTLKRAAVNIYHLIGQVVAL
jgi:branched-subunit amino acid aminotransferase/4-amino-4-deoxychorismate lyase